MKIAINLIFGLLIIFNSSNTAFAEKTIRIATGEWIPYLSQNLKHNGVINHIITEAFSIEGIKAIYKFFPWSRSQKLAESGKFDATGVWRYSLEREKLFFLVSQFFRPKSYFFN